jgi:hypothetical protein
MSMTGEVRAPLGHADELIVGGEWVAPSSARSTAAPA